MPPLPFLFPWRSLYWKSSGHGQIVLLLGLAVQGGELFGLLTWMNCWGNVEAGNGWIVYINMINIALINHLSVIYRCFFFFYTWLSPGNSGEYHSAASSYPHRGGSGSSAGPSVGSLSYTAPTLSESMFPDGSLLPCVGFCLNSCWGGKTEANAKATTRPPGLNVLSDRRVHDVLFRAWRIFFHFGPNFVSVFFFLNRRAVFLKECYGFLWEGWA